MRSLLVDLGSDPGKRWAAFRCNVLECAPEPIPWDSCWGGDGSRLSSAYGLWIAWIVCTLLGNRPCWRWLRSVCRRWWRSLNGGRQDARDLGWRSARKA